MARVLGLAAALVAGLAGAEPDAFFLGTGRAGVRSITALNTRVNDYARVISISPPATEGSGHSLEVDTTTGFTSGDLVMVYQTTRVTTENAPDTGSQTPVSLLTQGLVGRWELGRVTVSVGGPPTLTFTKPLVRNFTVPGTQVIKVPEYTTLTVDTGASIVAAPWDGNKGGVVAFLAQGTVTNNGTISAAGAGFRGGQALLNPSTSTDDCTETTADGTNAGAQKGEGIQLTKYQAAARGRGNVANGGGGGCQFAGGGGGGNRGQGGRGGDTPGGVGTRQPHGGLGGAALAYSLVEGMTLGGGGGAGSASSSSGGGGGAGGGVILIRANELESGPNSVITAAGANGVDASATNNHGAGGGGAGGSIILRFAQAATCRTVSARGGDGGSSSNNNESPGGGGGGGRVLLQATTLTDCAPEVQRGLAGVDGGGPMSNHGAEPATLTTTGSYDGEAEQLPGGFAELPQPTITAPVHDSTITDNTPLIAGTAAVSKLVVAYLDDVEQSWVFTPGTSFSFNNVQTLPDGTYRLEVTLTESGVHSPKSSTVSFTVDTTPPTVVGLAGPPQFSNSPSATFTFSASETGSTFECQLDSNTIVPGCVSGVELTGLTELPAPHRFRVRATDPWGNGGSNATWAEHMWTVDLAPPQAPVITAPNSGGYLGAGQSITGTVQEDINVRLLVDGTARGTVTASGNAWSFLPANGSPSIDPGPHWVQAIAVDLAGNESPPSEGRVFTLDTAAPGVPVVTSVGNGGVVRTNPPVIQGTAEAGSTVTVLLDDESAVQVITNAAQTWTFVPDTALDESEAHTLLLHATDAAGNSSAVSSPFAFNVDSVRPARPTVDAVGTNGYTNDPTPTLTGTAEAGSTVTVYLDDVQRTPTVTATAGGTWSFTPAAAITPENTQHWVRVTATDAAGNVSELSNTVVFVVDSVAPVVPTIHTPDNGSSVSAEELVLRGTAEAGTTVTVLRDGVSDGEVVAVAPGEWRFVLPLSLPEGTYSFVVESSDGVNPPVASTTAYSLTVDRMAPETTIVSGPLPVDDVQDVPFDFGSEPGASFECKLEDAALFTPCDEPYIPSGITLNQSHTLLVRARDSAGNVDPTPASHTWVVDDVDPAAPDVTFPAPGQSVSSALPTLTGAAEPGALVAVVIDGTPRGSVTADDEGAWELALEAPALSDTSHALQVTQTDVAGNSGPGSVTAFNFTVDTAEPDTSMTGPALRTQATTATFNLSSNESAPGLTYQCSLDGAAFEPCPATHTLSSVTVGAHLMRARAVDAAGNVDATPASHAWTVDQTPPDTLITRNPGALTNQLTVTFEFQSNEDAATYGCRLGSTGAFSSCVTPHTFTVPDDGAYRLEVQAIDGASNVDASPAFFEWTVDSVEPDAPEFTSPASEAFVSSVSPSIQGTAEAGSRVVVTVAGQPPGTTVTGGDGVWAFTPGQDLPQGLRHVQAVAQDAAGNESAPSGTLSFTVDTVAPETVIAEMPPDPSTSSSLHFVFATTVQSEVVTFECSINGVAINPCTPTLDVSRPDGSYTISVRARDQAGNVDPVPATYSWTVDATPPETTIETGPASLTSSSTARFTFSSTASGPAYFCSLNGAAFAPCTSPHQLTDLATGNYVLEVYSRDQALNVDPTPASYPWRVDRDLPETEIRQGPGALVNSLSATFEFWSNKLPNASFECSIDRGAFVACLPTVTLPVFGDGEHRLDVRSRDTLVGTVDPEPAFRIWTVDTQAPNTVLDDVPELLTSEAEATFEFSSPDATATFQCDLDGTGYRSCTSPATIPLGHGRHTMTIQARDPAGNEDGTPASYTFDVDLRPPGPPVLSAPSAEARLNTKTPEFKGTAEPGSEVLLTLDLENADDLEIGRIRADETGRWSFTPESPIPDGTHRLVLYAVDQATNQSGGSDASVFIVDTAAPETTIVAGPDGRVRTSSVSFTFGSDDPDAQFECGFDAAEFEPCGSEKTYSDLQEGTYTLKVRAVDLAENRDSTPESRTFKVYLGNDVRTRGGGLSCASTGGGGPSAALLGLAGLVLMAARRRRR